MEDYPARVGIVSVERFPAVGMSEDLRLRGPGSTGRALVLDSVLVQWEEPKGLINERVDDVCA